MSRCIVNMEFLQSYAAQNLPPKVAKKFISHVVKSGIGLSNVDDHVVEALDGMRKVTATALAQMHYPHVRKAIGRGASLHYFVGSRQLMLDVVWLQDWLCGLEARDPQSHAALHRMSFIDMVNRCHVWHHFRKRAIEEDRRMRASA